MRSLQSSRSMRTGAQTTRKVVEYFVANTFFAGSGIISGYKATLLNGRTGSWGHSRCGRVKAEGEPNSWAVVKRLLSALSEVGLLGVSVVCSLTFTSLVTFQRFWIARTVSTKAVHWKPLQKRTHTLPDTAPLFSPGSYSVKIISPDIVETLVDRPSAVCSQSETLPRIFNRHHGGAAPALTAHARSSWCNLQIVTHRGQHTTTTTTTTDNCAVYTLS